MRVGNRVWWSNKYENSIMAFPIHRNVLTVFHDLVCECNNIIGPRNWKGITLERRSTAPMRLIVRETIVVVDDAIIWFHRRNRAAVGMCVVNIRIVMEGRSVDWDTIVEGGELGHLRRDHDNSNLNWWRGAVWKEKRDGEFKTYKNTKQAGN